jgi:hypothetical protein
VRKKSVLVLGCLLGVGLLLFSVVALAAAPGGGGGPSALPVLVGSPSSPAALPERPVSVAEVGSALPAAAEIGDRWRPGRLARTWVMPVKAEGVPTCNEWAVRVGGSVRERFFAAARDAEPTRFAGADGRSWRTGWNHHYVAGVVFADAAAASDAWAKIHSAVAGCPLMRRELGIRRGVKMTAQRNSPVSNEQLWMPEAEGSLPGGWRWLRVRELTREQDVIRGRDSARHAVLDYALRGNVVVAQMQRVWGRPDQDWTSHAARVLDRFTGVLRRLPGAVPCGAEGCGAP